MRSRSSPSTARSVRRACGILGRSLSPEAAIRSLLELLKTTLIGGLLIVLPVYLAILLLVKGVAGILGSIAPITAQIPTTVEYRQLAAAALILAVCFAAGLAVRTRPGSLARGAVENHVLAGSSSMMNPTGATP